MLYSFESPGLQFIVMLDELLCTNHVIEPFRFPQTMQRGQYFAKHKLAFVPPNPKLPILLARESPTASTAPFGLLRLISPWRFAILNSLIEVPAHRPLLPRLFCASCAKMKPHSIDMYQPRAREDHVKVWRRMGGAGSEDMC